MNMKLVTAMKNWWSGSSLSTKFLSVGGVLASAVLVISVAVSAGGQGKTDEPELKAQIVLPSETATHTATNSPTPTPSESPSAEEKVAPQTKAAPHVNAAPAVDVAPSFEAFTSTANDYGIGQQLDNGPSTFPTGIVYAAAALPAAQGTGPISYSVTGLPTGAGFDADARKIYIDADTFIPANAVGYTYNSCYPRQKVSMTVTVQYLATGPGGQATASVPLNFGVVTAPAGMFRFGC